MYELLTTGLCMIYLINTGKLYGYSRWKKAQRFLLSCSMTDIINLGQVFWVGLPNWRLSAFASVGG